MARSKPNKLKSPHKHQIEEQNKEDKTEITPHITPQTYNTNKKATGIKERSIKSSTTREEYIRNPENIPYYDGDTNIRRTYRRDRNQHQLDEDGETINSTDDEFVQPLDEDAQGNVLTDEELTRKIMADVKRTPSKEDIKPAAQPEDENSPPSPEQPRERLRKRYHESEQMKQLFTDLAKDTQTQFKEQGEKHAMEIAATKRANLDTQNLLTKNTTPAQTMIDQINCLLNYTRSRNPSCARAHMQRQIQAPGEPLNLGVCSRVCALSQDRT
jgi:hypothetical protein